jgi:hypothetical protein
MKISISPFLNSSWISYSIFTSIYVILLGLFSSPDPESCEVLPSLGVRRRGVTASVNFYILISFFFGTTGPIGTNYAI